MSTDAVFLEEVTAFLETGFLNIPFTQGAEAESQPFVGSSGYEPAEVCTHGSDGTSAKSCYSVIGYEALPATRTRSEKEGLRKRRYHQRMKKEREELREMVSELSQQIEHLQHAAQEANISRESGGGVVYSAWKAFTVWQHSERMRSEATQKQLLVAARARASCIQNLCKSVPSGAASSTAIAINTPDKVVPFDHTMFRAHVEKVDKCYLRVDEVLGEHRMESIPDGATTSVHRHGTDSEVAYFQHLSKYTQRCSYHQMQQCMWNLAQLHNQQQDREDFDTLENSENTVVIRFRQSRTLATGASISVLYRYVNRWFIEGSRTVFVWKTISEGEGIASGMKSEETGWIRLQPSPSEGETLVRVCIQQTPMRFVSSLRDFIIGESSNVLQSSVGDEMLEISRALNRMLLKDIDTMGSTFSSTWKVEAKENFRSTPSCSAIR